MEFQERIALLLKMMKKDRAEGDYNCSEDSEFLDSSDQSETETETNTDDNYDRCFHLNKFFDDIGETKKYVTSNIENDTNDDILFDNKMYRVIPMKLDELPKLGNNKNQLQKSNKNHKQSTGRVQRQTKHKH